MPHLRLQQLLPLSIICLCACAAPPRIGVDAPGDPAKPVRAVAETVVSTDPQVDADDPALWADERDPARALLFGTDKSDGLYVHHLDGSVRQFFADGPLNNVDLRTGFVIDGRAQVLVAATDRMKFGVRLYLLDPQTLNTKPYGFIPVDFGEPYGFCLGRRGDVVYAVINNKEGVTLQIRIEAGAEGPIGTIEPRRVNLGTQPEGCVVDDEAQQLYIGEEDVAVWRFDFNPTATTQATEIARVDGQRIVADIEGLAIMRDGGHKYLVVSSQGDSTYPVYRIEDDGYTYVGRFAVVAGETIDGTRGTDGLSAWSGPIGSYPQGLLAIHDEDDEPNRGQQNYKLVDWREVKAALNLP